MLVLGREVPNMSGGGMAFVLAVPLFARFWFGSCKSGGMGISLGDIVDWQKSSLADVRVTL